MEFIVDFWGKAWPGLVVFAGFVVLTRIANWIKSTPNPPKPPSDKKKLFNYLDNLLGVRPSHAVWEVTQVSINGQAPSTHAVKTKSNFVGPVIQIWVTRDNKTTVVVAGHDVSEFIGSWDMSGILVKMKEIVNSKAKDSKQVKLDTVISAIEQKGLMNE